MNNRFPSSVYMYLSFFLNLKLFDYVSGRRYCSRLRLFKNIRRRPPCQPGFNQSITIQSYITERRLYEHVYACVIYIHVFVPLEVLCTSNHQCDCFERMNEMVRKYKILDCFSVMSSQCEKQPLTDSP